MTISCCFDLADGLECAVPSSISAELVPFEPVRETSLERDGLLARDLPQTAIRLRWDCR